MLNKISGASSPSRFWSKISLCSINKIADAIAAAEHIAILPHVAADGDALGSTLALALALNEAGKKVSVFLEEDIPYIYSFLPGSRLAAVYKEMVGHYDIVVAVDCGDIGRLGKRKEIFDSTSVTANIDHHPTNTGFAVHNFLDTSASASAEIIYKLLKILGIKTGLEIATCLYVGIVTDTGCFRYSNTTPLTHMIAAELIQAGVLVADVSEKVLDSSSYEKVKLTGEAIHTLELFENGKIAMMTVPNEMIRKTGAKEEDFDGIINTARNIRGVEVAAMLREWDIGDIKVNLRSNSTFDVAAIASIYSGGGHKKAAGYTISGSLEQAKNNLLEDLRKAL